MLQESREESEGAVGGAAAADGGGEGTELLEAVDDHLKEDNGKEVEVEDGDGDGYDEASAVAGKVVQPQ